MTALLTVLVLLFTLSPWTALAGSAETDVSRIFGQSRYETAFRIADALKEQLGKSAFDAVIVACGDNFPDALTGSYLSVQKNAPVLLTDNRNTAELCAYIRENLCIGGTVYILGGTAAVSAATETALANLENTTTVRLSGEDRYATNLEILREAGGVQDEVLVSTGLTYADSLSAAAVGKPILLLSPEGLRADQQAFLEDVSKIYIVGGLNAVDAATAEALSLYAPVERIGGTDRYETSVKVAEAFFADPEAAVLAYGENFPDGLCGGSLAHVMGGPLLLSGNTAYRYAEEFVSKKSLAAGVVLGGSGLIADKTAGTIFGTGDNTPIPEWAGKAETMAQVKLENVEKVLAYADAMYRDNRDIDPVSGSFTWHGESGKPNLVYYTGLMQNGFLELDFDRYHDDVQEFYSQYIQADGVIRNYAKGTLDAVLPAVNILTLLNGDTLSAEERIRYEKAVNYVYSQLESQVSYPQAGNLLMHAQDSEGNPQPGWQTWTVCLDGVFMSQLFLIRLAELIDAGKVTVLDGDGSVVTSGRIWSDVYGRLDFVMKRMRSAETGLLYHGYCVEEDRVNGVFWSRGMGWFSMVLVEAAEKIPGEERQVVLRQYCEQLMSAVLRWQDPVSFLWYNVTDAKEEVTLQKDGQIIANQPETSGSAMFAYSLLRGYHTGVLQGEEFRAAGLRAFNALAEIKLTNEGLTDICLKSAVYTSRNMYQVFGYAVNDGKGAAPLIMAVKYVY